MQLCDDDVLLFATASGDLNPLHRDELFARRTPYGRPIVHGALTALAALAAVPSGRLHRGGDLTLRFIRPVRTGTTYRLGSKIAADDTMSVTVLEGDLPVLSLKLSAGCPFADAVVPADDVLPTAPETPDLSRLVPGHRVSGAYAVRSLPALRRLAAGLAASHVPDPVLGALAWSSWFVGMRLPGRDGLFSLLKLRTGSRGSTAPPGYLATLRATDPYTGAIIVDARCGGAGTRLDMELRGFSRPPVPPPSLASATRSLPPDDRLTGTHTLVVGGSRGLGAALVATLATQGATALAGHHRSTSAVASLQRTFGSGHVRSVVFDATDPDRTELEFARLEAQGIRLDSVILNAGPPMRDLTVHPDTSRAMRDFVDTTLAMTLGPLASALNRLNPGGRLVVVSSSAVDELPKHWPHYAMAKAAVETLARHCALHRDVPTLVVRPPKMWTELTNDPLGRTFVVPPERVAAAIVTWLAGPRPAELVTTMDSSHFTS